MFNKNKSKTRKKSFLYVVITGILYGCGFAVFSMLFNHFLNHSYGSLYEVIFDFLTRWIWFGVIGVVVMCFIWRSNKRNNRNGYM